MALFPAGNINCDFESVLGDELHPGAFVSTLLLYKTSAKKIKDFYVPFLDQKRKHF